VRSPHGKISPKGIQGKGGKKTGLLACGWGRYVNREQKEFTSIRKITGHIQRRKNEKNLKNAQNENENFTYGGE